MKIILSFSILALTFFSCSNTNSPKLFAIKNADNTLPLVFNLEDYHIIVDAQINGKAYKLILDTGSPITFINSKIANDIKSSGKNAVVNHEMKTYKSVFDIYEMKHSIYPFIADSIIVGGFRFTNFPVYKQDDLTVDGVLGNDILSNFCMKFDFKNKQISFSRKNKFDLSGDLVMPFIRIENVPNIKVKIDGTDCMFIFDSGAGDFATLNEKDTTSTMLIAKTIWKTLNEPLPMFSGSNEQFMAKEQYLIEDFSEGNLNFPNEVINISSTPQIVGMNFLLRFDHVIVDYKAGKIYLGRPHKNTSADYVKSLRKRINSMGIDFKRGKFTIINKISYTVDTSTLALGDTVIALNGVEIMNQVDTFYTDRMMNLSETASRWMPSKYKKTIAGFLYGRDVSDVTILNHGKRKTVQIHRQYNYNYEMPDTLHCYNVNANEIHFARAMNRGMIKKDYVNGGNFLYNATAAK